MVLAGLHWLPHLWCFFPLLLCRRWECCTGSSTTSGRCASGSRCRSRSMSACPCWLSGAGRVGAGGWVGGWLHLCGSHLYQHFAVCTLITMLPHTDPPARLPFLRCRGPPGAASTQTAAGACCTTWPQSSSARCWSGGPTLLVLLHPPASRPTSCCFGQAVSDALANSHCDWRRACPLALGIPAAASAAAETWRCTSQTTCLWELQVRLG